MSDEHEHQLGQGFNIAHMEEYVWCIHCKKRWSKDEVQNILNTKERLDMALIMGDDEILAYQWAIKQLFQSVAADYARKLAKYIRRVKIAYREPK